VEAKPFFPSKAKGREGFKKTRKQKLQLTKKTQLRKKRLLLYYTIFSSFGLAKIWFVFLTELIIIMLSIKNFIKLNIL